MFATAAGDGARETTAEQPRTAATAEYCAKLQQWMWRYYCGCASWQSWVALSASPCPPPGYAGPSWHSYLLPVTLPASSSLPAGAQAQPSPRPSPAAGARQQNGDQPQAGLEFTVPSALQRLLAETVDFFILFCVKATIVLWIMHLDGMRDIAKFITQFIVEEIDENTSMEDLQKMMAVALVYRVFVCVYEIICIWGADGATPGKFLLGLQVVKCDTTTLVRSNRVLVVPASTVSLYVSTVRALNKNFSIAFLFPVFLTVLFFQHNRTVYDIVAGTIVVQRRGGT